MPTICGKRPHVIVLAAIVALSAHGRAQVSFDGNGGDHNPVPIGDPSTLAVNGPPLANFCLFGGTKAGSFNTPIGFLGVDIFDPSFRLGIDGFTPGSPTFNLGWLDANGRAAFTLVPFPQNSPIGAELFGQAAVVSPTNIFGAQLVSRAGAVSTAVQPRIEWITPHSAVPGQPVTLHGCNLGGASNNGQEPVVTLNGDPLVVVSHDETTVQVIIDASSESGPLVLNNVGGTSAVTDDGWTSWVSVFKGALLGEAAASAGPMVGAHTVIGNVANSQDVDVYELAVTTGDEVFCEVHTYDPAIVDIRPHDPATPIAGGVNPYVEIDIPGYPVDFLRADDNGGPLFASAVGVHQGSRFVAPRTGTIRVAVESRFNATWGQYVLNLWTEPTGPGEPPELLVVDPNISPPGTNIELLAWGMTPLAPPAAVIFPGPAGTTVESVPFLDENGRLMVAVPPTAQSGPLRLRNAAGLVSVPEPDPYRQFFMVQRNGRLEAQTTHVVDDDQVLGEISVIFEADSYLINLAAGDRLHVHCAPFDLTAMRMLRGQGFSAGLLDSHLVIRDPVTGTVYASDNNSGTGNSAMIGGMNGNPFVAPMAMQYEILVRGFLTISTGPYILDVQVD